jgi:hypothetical protein
MEDSMATSTQRPTWKHRDWKTNVWRGLAVGGGDHGTPAGPSLAVLSVASFVATIAAAIMGKWSGASIFLALFVAFAIGHFALNWFATYAAKRGGMRPWRPGARHGGFGS